MCTMAMEPAQQTHGEKSTFGMTRSDQMATRQNNRAAEECAQFDLDSHRSAGSAWAVGPALATKRSGLAGPTARDADRGFSNARTDGIIRTTGSEPSGRPLVRTEHA